MEIGDMVVSRNRYTGNIFIIVDKILGSTEGKNIIKCIRITDGYKTRWSDVKTWEKICK
jgi:hypothetical protein|tara:strand:+ start:1268 stop:1444 length:177 start_codon:yes stop_codon:yes gene_type:complete